LTFLTHRLRPSVGPLLAPVSWRARISGTPSPQRLAERDDLLDVVEEAPGDRLVQQHRRIAHVLAEVDVADRLLGQPRPDHLVVGVTGAQAEQHAVSATVVEALIAGEEHLADPIQRIAAAAPVAERVVLHPAADRSTQRLATRTTWNGSATRRA
jgi:hypothetical protein